VLTQRSHHNFSFSPNRRDDLKWLWDSSCLFLQMSVQLRIPWKHSCFHSQNRSPAEVTTNILCRTLSGSRQFSSTHNHFSIAHAANKSPDGNIATMLDLYVHVVNQVDYWVATNVSTFWKTVTRDNNLQACCCGWNISDYFWNSRFWRTQWRSRRHDHDYMLSLMKQEKIIKNCI